MLDVRPVRLACRQYPHLGGTPACGVSLLFRGQQREGDVATGVGQLDGQLQVRRPQGAQPARGFQTAAGGAQVVPVHRLIATLLQQALNVPSGHRSGTARSSEFW